MQHVHDQDLTSPTASVPSTSGDHINLNEFPSQLDFTSALDHNREAYPANDSSEISQRSIGPMKSVLNNSGRHSRVTNLMYPKVGRRPFQCKYCVFSCPSATNLSIHMRIHTGEKPYKCGTCSYASARKQNLFRHMATVHKADHVTMCGSSPAMCAYPIGSQSSSEEQLPVVENVYGNVQDVVLIDGDPVKIMGRDRGSFPASEAASSSPLATPVFPCESSSHSSQDDIEVLPPSNPTPVSEYSTRHYADGSRFIFAGGVIAATSSSTSPTVGSPQTSGLNHQFESSKETQKMPIPMSIVSNRDLPTLGQSLISPAKAPAKPESPLQPAIYKEPITGALKRKQGRSTHSTLKTILDSPLVLGNKECGSPPSVPPKGLSSADQLEKTGTGIKIIQTEEDLEEVLEARQRLDAPVASSGLGKHHDLEPSPRNLNGGSLVDSLAFHQPRETPDSVRYLGANTTLGRTEEEDVPSVDTILPVQAGMFRHRHVSTMKPSPARKLGEHKGRSSQMASEDVIVVEQVSKRAVPSNMSGPRKQTQQSFPHTTQLSTDDHSSLINLTEERVEYFQVHGQQTPGRKQHPGAAIDIDRNQRLGHGGLHRDSPAGLARTSLTIQVDLNKVMCCAARKLLRAHLVDCDVCEVNLPSVHEEPCSANGSGCRRGRSLVQEYDDSYLRGGRCQRHPREKADDDQAQTLNRQFTTGEGNLVNPGDTRQQHPRDGQVDFAMPPSQPKCLSSQGEYPSLAETAVVSTSNVPISSTYFRDGSAGAISRRLFRGISEPQESAEYIAFLNAEQARGKAVSKRKRPKVKCSCDICGKVCHSRAQLLSHRRVHIETSQLFRCAVCRYCTLHYKLLKRHIAAKHSAASKQNSFAECKVCRKAVRVTAVASHMQTVHGHVIRATEGKSVDGGGNVEAECLASHEHATAAEHGVPQASAAVAMETDQTAIKDSEASSDAQEDSTIEGGSTVPDVAIAIKQETVGQT